MSSLLDELRSERRPARVCATCQWIQGREKAEHAEWAEAFADRSISTGAIHRAMKARDFKYGESAVGNHRRAGH